MTSRPSTLRVAVDVTAVPLEPVGAGRYTIELVRALERRSDIALTLLSRRDDAQRWQALSQRHAGDFEVRGIAPKGRAARVLYGEVALGRFASRMDPAAAAFHGPHYQLPRGLSVPGVVTIHDLTFVEHPEWHQSTKVRYFRHALRVATERAAMLVCVSEWTRARLVEHFQPAGEVRVVPHGIDHERFRPTPDPEDAAVRAALGVRAPYVLHLGTIEPRKNLPGLVRAFGRLASTMPELTLVLAGRPGWGVEHLRRAVGTSPARDRVVEAGYVGAEAVPALLRGAACVAYPSLEEGFGLPALEALSCGAPLVTTTGSVMAELAGDAALLVEPGDEAALADALREALSDGSAADRRREAGLSRAAEFTWERCAAGHLEAYRLAAASDPSSGATVGRR